MKKKKLYLFSTIFYNLKLIVSSLERSEYKINEYVKKKLKYKFALFVTQKKCLNSFRIENHGH